VNNLPGVSGQNQWRPGAEPGTYEWPLCVYCFIYVNTAYID